MTAETLRRFFAWCTVINVPFLLLWFLLFVAADEWMTTMSGRFFGIPADRVAWINFAGIATFKMAIWFFNLAPYIALRILDARK